MRIRAPLALAADTICNPILFTGSALLFLLPQDLMHAGKRLQLLVRGDGRILTFKADPAVLAQVFGLDAAGLVTKVRKLVGHTSCLSHIGGRSCSSAAALC